MHASPPRSHTPPRQAILAGLAVVLAVLGLLTPVFSKLAIPVMTGALLVFLALPKEGTSFVRISRLLLLIVAPVMLFGLLRFTVTEAAPGIVEGGRRALTGRAVAKLRVLVFTQDIAREQAIWDPDGDGIGSALTLRELVGQDPVRGKTPLPSGTALQLGPAQGPVALVDGYAFRVWLPARDGTWTDDPALVDDEAAERRFLAYAWPVDDGHGERMTVFIDEHERILLHDSRTWLGAGNGPPAAAAIDGDGWTPWKDKQPRTTLPGID